MKEYKEHELSKIIPSMSDGEYDRLKNDIKEFGFDEEYPIFLYENQILDGRHRYKACKELEIDAKFKNYQGKKSALEFVISSNIKRRHLSKSQWAAIAVDILPKFEAEARERQTASLRKGNKNTVTRKFVQREQGESADRAGKLFDVSGDYVRMARKIKDQKPELFEEIKDGTMDISQAKRAIKKEKREEDRNEDRKTLKNIPDIREALGKVKFPTITIDPPWDWGDEGDDDQLGRARPDYATMSFEEILKFPVSDFADKDCHIYLWITNRSLPKGFALLEAWGFRYITCITWCKPSFGMGNYFRGATEHVLFGVKGSQELKRKNATTWFQAKRGKGGHSSKPEEFYTLVESCSPGPYLEIFARQQKDKRNDWTCWGNE